MISRGRDKMNRRTEKILTVSIPTAILLLFAGVLRASAMPVPVFSVDSGFYGEAFTVTVKVPSGCTAYYTLDGTEPNESSALYSSEILIYDRTPEDAHLAASDSVSGQSIWSMGGIAYTPSQPVPKATVLTVKLLDQYGRWSDSVRKFYYVGEDYEKYLNFTVVSLNVSPESLFGEDGIYMNGKEYESYLILNNISDVEIAELSRIWALANWWEKGENARKPAFVSILKEGRVYQSGAEINISGHASRIYPQKSFTLRFDSASDWLLIDENYDAIGNKIQGLSTYKLRNGGTQNQNDFLNDYICQALSSGLAFDTQAQQLCVLFLNGEYWGLYELTEKYNDEYFYSHYGLKKQNHPALIKSGLYLDLGREDAKTNYDAFVDWIEESDFSDDKTYDILCQKADIASLVQLYAANLYLTNLDFVNNNIACWSYLDPENSQYTKWKWMMYDCDTTFNDVDLEYMLKLYLDSDPLFAKMCQNDRFCYELAAAVRELQMTVFCPKRVDCFIDKTINELLPFVEDHYNRIGPGHTAALDSAQKRSHFRDYGEKVKDFFSARYRMDTSSIEDFLAANRYFPVKTIWLSGEDWNADQHIASGISQNEGSHTWTDQTEVIFNSLYLGENASETKCRMNLSIRSTYGEQQISVIVNEQEGYRGSVSSAAELIIPFLTDDHGRAAISLYLPDAVSPRELGEGSDKRKLSLSLRSITFEQNSPIPRRSYEFP